MNRKEAIEILTELGYLFRYYVHVYEELYPGRISERWKDIAAIDFAIDELRSKQEHDEHGTDDMEED